MTVPSTLAPPPLAEGRWLWRRLYVFATSGAAWLLLDRLIAGAPPEAAQRLAQALMTLLALIMVLYLVAPTAQQLIATLAVLRPRLGGEDRP
jgi:TRAP-type C4-dicarboxylate transport system permease large subunit